MRMKKFTYGIGIVVIIFVICGMGVYLLVNFIRSDSPAMTPAAAETSPSLINTQVLAQLHQNDASGIDLSHIAAGLTPPTNKWFSGFALQRDPKPGFGYPNSYRPLMNGFEMGLPVVSATNDTVSGPHRADVVVTIERAVRYEIVRYDELTVEIAYFASDNQKLATLTIGSGLPYAFLSAETAIKVSTNLPALKHQDDHLATVTVAGQTYGVQSKTITPHSGAMELNDGELLTWFSAPEPDDARHLSKYASNRVLSGVVSYRFDKDHYETELSYSTSNHQPTIIVRMPHQYTGGKTKSLFSYRSIFGDLKAEATNKLVYTTPSVPLKPSLDIGRLSSDDKNKLLTQLKQDGKTLQLSKPDTYFAGKEMQRVAQLLDIAAQLGAKQEQQEIQTSLKAALVDWLRTNKASVRSFYYDTKMRGIVGNEASFGADKEFNDHHFHYGYFIYAASILAKYDPGFVKEHSAVVNLLAADIANYKPNEELPLRRNFDPYSGHGWASGISPFLDGNNQESSSEAMNAWTSVALWAQQTKNKTLETEALWMLSNEIATAKKYWLQSNSENVCYLRAYTAPLVAINWGGKREYRTFFSDEPNAKLGIQLIPFNPSMAALLTDMPAKALSSHTPTGMFGDYIMMAQASTQTFEAAQRLPDTAIDDGDSRTYLYAWMLTH
ncbi:MAG: Endo,3(4)-beta-glucanase [Candidatus Saccharibacteria bacterium]|nr:Endo,3(4)-beta-glucanase [Candidatus Saccharibacteria bacterium]